MIVVHAEVLSESRSKDVLAMQDTEKLEKLGSVESGFEAGGRKMEPR
jgi:hypothetical protein